MAGIAIKGNAEMGHEIINLLRMMGGNNVEYYTGRNSSLYYFIDDHTKYISTEDVEIMEYGESGVYMLFSLSCFKDNYPWVVGDIVNVIGRENRVGLKIVKMQWGNAYNTMMYCLDCGEDGYGWWRAEDIQYTKYSDFKVNLDDNVDMNVEFDLAKYSYKVNDGKLIIEEKKPKYPKTYKGCCLIMGGVAPERHLQYDTTPSYKFEEDLRDSLEILRKLFICRNAYWKIAGEEMGLDEPWEPDWSDVKQLKFGIHTVENQIRCITLHVLKNLILVFPTEEMRDAFFENFKDLIEECKEFL